MVGVNVISLPEINSLIMKNAKKSILEVAVDPSYTIFFLEM
jgi:hypothetical protein